MPATKIGRWTDKHKEIQRKRAATRRARVAKMTTLSSSDYKKFLSTNNSVLNINGAKSDSDGTPFYDYAAWGLVSKNLKDEELYTSGDEALEPHFNKAFLDKCT